MTDTAREADIILPAKSMFEQSDIIGSYWNPYVQLKQKVIEPPGDVLPETDIYYYLSHKLLFPQAEINKHIPKPSDYAIESWLDKYISRYKGLSLELLKKGPVLAMSNEEIAFEDMKFKTPSGKIELLSLDAKNIWGVSELPSCEVLKENPKSNGGKYPLFLMSPVTKNRIHSQFGNLDCITMLDPTQHVSMSSIDAKERNLKEGEMVRVFNARGEIDILLRLDNSIRPGNVVIYNGYWNREPGGVQGGSPNLLSKGRETDMGHGAAFHDNMVDVIKIDE